LHSDETGDPPYPAYPEVWFSVRAKKVKSSQIWNLLTNTWVTSKKKECILIFKGILSKKVNANIKI
jgi:hypothetical protein